ncbi:hypothetical protein ACHAXT_006395 [Thalassiosira profunda]
MFGGGGGFSANENIILRKHKTRVVEYIEATIPEKALELGTSVMVMQVSCRQPGCVPLETAITVVFPKPPKKKVKQTAASEGQTQTQQRPIAPPAFPQPLVPGLEESRTGGAFKARILKPLAEVTREDVLEALPPSFEGGRRTTESLCLKARDMTFAQIGQLVGIDDTADSREGRRLVAEYLKACLDEYIERDCVAPEWGEPFAPLEKEEKSGDGPQKVEDDTEEETDVETNGNSTATSNWGDGNLIFHRQKTVEADVEKTIGTEPSDIWNGGNLTFHRRDEDLKQESVPKAGAFAPSSQELLQRMTQSRHAPGVRQAGCPCCDPDSASNYADQMLGL